MGRVFLNWNNLKQNSIILHLKSTEKKAAIRELLDRAPIFADLRDPESLEKAILSREKVMSTGIGRGVAICHGEARHINGTVVAMGLSDVGIEFEALDNKPVHILFAVVNSRHNRAEYLEVLSTLTKLMRNEELRQKIRCCTGSGEVERILHSSSIL